MKYQKTPLTLPEKAVLAQQMDADNLSVDKMAELLGINSKMVSYFLPNLHPITWWSKCSCMTKFYRTSAAPATWKALYTKKGRVCAVCD
jgi:hypothetical protein